MGHGSGVVLSEREDCPAVVGREWLEANYGTFARECLLISGRGYRGQRAARGVLSAQGLPGAVLMDARNPPAGQTWPLAWKGDGQARDAQRLEGRRGQSKACYAEIDVSDRRRTTQQAQQAPRCSPARRGHGRGGRGGCGVVGPSLVPVSAIVCPSVPVSCS